MAYYKQVGVILEMNNCTDPKWRPLKIIEGLRGKAMEYFDTLPVEVAMDGELLCKEMCLHFGDKEPGLSLSPIYIRWLKKGGKPVLEIWAFKSVLFQFIKMFTVIGPTPPVHIWLLTSLLPFHFSPRATHSISHLVSLIQNR